MYERERDVLIRAIEHFSQPGAQLAAIESEDGRIGSVKTCRYRVDMTPGDPRRCAIGVSIPDEQYEPWMDGEDGDLEQICAAVPALNGMDRHVLAEIQSLHDMATTVEDAVIGMRGALDNWESWIAGPVDA